MKRLWVLLLTGILLITSCNTPASTIKLGVTLDSEIKAMAGRKVTVTGYMSWDSAEDGTLMYLYTTPFCSVSLSAPYKFAVLAPAKGKTIEFTDACITVTGIVKYQVVDKDYNGFTYNYVLTDVSYEVTAPTADIELYNDIIAQGYLATLNEKMLVIQNGLYADDIALPCEDNLHLDEAIYYLTNVNNAEKVTEVFKKCQEVLSEYNAWVSLGAYRETTTYQDITEKERDAVNSMVEYVSTLSLYETN